MENKLELKHLAAYLPFGLKVRSFREGQALFLEDISMSGEFIDYLFEKSEVRTYSTLIYKPILRPLSDLTKEITHNGETFVPIERLFLPEINISCSDIIIIDNSIVFRGLFKDKVLSTLDYERMNYKYVQKLLEWHFDIYSLIPQNLAIGINTI